MLWNLPESTKTLWREKPNSYISNLIGHEGPNSLLSQLISEGLATALSASGSSRVQDAMDQFSVDISLTEKGERDYERVLELIYMFINKIKAEGIKSYIHEESKQMSVIGFDNITKSSALSYSQNLCYRMSKIPFEEEIPDLLWRPYGLERFDPEEIMKRMELLSP